MVEKTDVTTPPAVVVSGDLDLAAAPEFARRLRAAERSTSGDVVVDLSAVRFLDCSGVRPLVESRARLGARLVLRSPSPPVLWLLELTELLSYLGVDGQRSRAATEGAAEDPRGPAVPMSRHPSSAVGAP